MESFIKAENSGKNICAVYAHNDDMAIGAIQAIKEAGLKPGKDIKIISIDGVPDIFKAMIAGEANASVELTPNMAGPAFDALLAYKKDGTLPPNISRRSPNCLSRECRGAARAEKRHGLLIPPPPDCHIARHISD